MRYAGTLADHCVTRLFCKPGSERKLQVVKKAHALRLGKGLLSRL